MAAPAPRQCGDSHHGSPLCWGLVDLLLNRYCSGAGHCNWRRRLAAPAPPTRRTATWGSTGPRRRLSDCCACCWASLLAATPSRRAATRCHTRSVPRRPRRLAAGVSGGICRRSRLRQADRCAVPFGRRPDRSCELAGRLLRPQGVWADEACGKAIVRLGADRIRRRAARCTRLQEVMVCSTVSEASVARYRMGATSGHSTT